MTLDIYLWLGFMVSSCAYLVFFMVRRGLTLGMLTFTFFLLLPISMYPFAFSVENTSAVAAYLFAGILEQLPRALYITLLSVALFLAGFAAQRLLPGQQTRQPQRQTVLKTSLYLFETYFWTWRAMLISLAVMTVLFVVLIGLGVPYGSGQAFAFEVVSLRPLLNIWAALCTTYLVIMTCHAFHSMRPGPWVVLGIAFVLSLLTGQRAASVLPVVFGGGLCLIASRVRVGIAQGLGLVVGGAVALVAALVISGLRNGVALDDLISSDVIAEALSTELLYGNQFSDLRDFAWILSGFDGNYVLGKTYLAGFTPFVPSYLSDFRTEWGWGRWSTDVAGINDYAHGGLRPPIFGEIFFNFGYPGLLVLCPLIGFLFARLLATLEQVLVPRTGDRRLAVVAFGFLVATLSINIFFTSGFFKVLVHIGLLFVNVVAVFFVDFLFPRRTPRLQRAN